MDILDPFHILSRNTINFFLLFNPQSDIINFFGCRKRPDMFPNVIPLLFKLLSNLYHMICLFSNGISCHSSFI